jgi:hypothetical protein
LLTRPSPPAPWPVPPALSAPARQLGSSAAPSHQRCSPPPPLPLRLTLTAPRAGDRALGDDAAAFGTVEAGGEGELEEGEEGPRYPEPEERAYYLPDLFAKAAYLPLAAQLDQGARPPGLCGLGAGLWCSWK